MRGSNTWAGLQNLGNTKWRGPKVSVTQATQSIFEPPASMSFGSQIARSGMVFQIQQLEILGIGLVKFKLEIIHKYLFFIILVSNNIYNPYN